MINTKNIKFKYTVGKMCLRSYFTGVRRFSLELCVTPFKERWIFLLLDALLNYMTFIEKTNSGGILQS